VSASAGPALRLLLRLKLRGALRKHARRLKTVSGLLLTLVGASLFLVWIASIIMPRVLEPGTNADPLVLRPLVGLGGLVLLFLTLSSSLSHRGLFVPREEIERLFASPASRADLVRYRLLVNVGRGAFGGVVLALVLMRHMPHALYAFLGAFVAAETLPIVGQIAAILSGALERATFQRVKRLGALSIPLGILAGLAIVQLAIGEGGALGRVLRSALGGRNLSELAQHPVLEALTLPLTPWVRTVLASSFEEFAPWCALCLLIAALLSEVAARLPIDFRELSLETSANVAERLRRMGSVGRGASAGRVSRRTLGLRVPWILGHGPAGAVAWRKAGAILRKARGTLIVSVVVLSFVILLATATFGRAHDDGDRIGGTLLVALLGLLYLSSGLRFDFRDELDRMESVKAWPLSSRRIFFAMLLPEVLLVSLLIAVAVLVKSAIDGAVEPVAVAAIVSVPLITFAWVAVDNAVFLLMPVRMVPGQEGALQNAGRGLLLLFLRMLLIGIPLGLASLVATLVWHAFQALHPNESAAATGAFAAGWCVLLGLDLLLVELGAWTFRRFDVARDRG
jgi:hypothetical protein